MYELYEIEINEPIFVGTIKEISNIIAYTESTIRSSVYKNTLIGKQYYVKRVGKMNTHRNFYDVYDDGILVAECLDTKMIADKYFLSESYIRSMARMGKPTKDGLLFKRREEENG